MFSEQLRIDFKPAKDAKPGDTAFYPDQDAPGAFIRGTRISKIGTKPGDLVPDRTLGTVLGSIGPVPEVDGHAMAYAYFVEWDTHPGMPIGIASWRITRAHA